MISYAPSRVVKLLVSSYKVLVYLVRVREVYLYKVLSVPMYIVHVHMYVHAKTLIAIYEGLLVAEKESYFTFYV